MTAEALIRQEIEHRGPMPFDQFVDLALYHPRYGYYNRKDPIRGRQGDYFTSLQVSPVFTLIMASAIEQLKTHLDASEFHLIEVGSGSGEFLEGLIVALTQRKALQGLRVFAVEKSVCAREQLKKRLSRFPKCQVVASLDEIDRTGGVEGCIFSNELFDAFPFHRLRYKSGRWLEVRVGYEDARFVEIETEPSSSVRVPWLLKGAWMEGQEIEIRSGVKSWYDEVQSLLVRGYILTLDYGYPRAQLVSARRPQGTWICYHQHRVNTEIFSRVGQQDITAHVDFTQLYEEGNLVGFDPAFFASQGLFLTHIGSADIQRFLDQSDPLNRAQRLGAIQQLIHPDAMGESFWVFVQTRSASLPPAWGLIHNRLARLSAT